MVATIAFYAVGAIFYDFAFMEAWGQQQLINHGMDPAQATGLTGQPLMDALNAIPGAMDPGAAYAVGGLIALVRTIGIALVLRMTWPASLGAAAGTSFVLWLCFAATTLAYNVVYSSESTTIFMIDLAHLLLAYLLASVVLFLMDGKAQSTAAASAAA